ncbi:MAG: haloalkane dehalogenase [Myxococcota bacterium]
MMRLRLPLLLLPLLCACGSSADSGSTPPEVPACDDEPVIRTTREGIDYVRTPDSCFADLPNWPYEPRYVELDGLRQAYVDEGPAEGPVVLLLHGQPSWSYLYRKMIPVLANEGYRVIAMDHLGMGRSDKPLDIADHSFVGHGDRLLGFIEALDLRDINLFVQDWGSLIGLRMAGLHPERFARIAVGDGALPVLPAGIQAFPPVEDPDELEEVDLLFAAVPAQQVPFYDGCTPIAAASHDAYFGEWMRYAMKDPSFVPSVIVEAMTWFDLSEAEEAAYDAPFPSRVYMAGPRVFPSLINEVPGETEEAREGLSRFERPFLTLWAANDPGGLGSCEAQNDLLLDVVGSNGMPHDRLPEASHFLQDDQGVQIATRLVDFFAAESLRFDLGPPYCEVLLLNTVDGGLEAEVWGTQNYSECADVDWDALDPDQIQSETGALMVRLNGPRIGVMDGAINSGGPRGLERRAFGNIQTRFMATLEVDPTQLQSPAPYAESRVRRTSRFSYAQGTEVYELTAADGTLYVMQSMSQIVDPSLTPGDLAGLGERLSLPDGWRFEARVLDEALELCVEGQAVVIADELQNVYQRVTPSEDEPAMPTLPVLADGTGTLCASDADCQGQDASVCLVLMGAGYCTPAACTAGSCGSPYVCCSGCNPAAAELLPFEDSACIPGAIANQLAQAGCSCS